MADNTLYGDADYYPLLSNWHTNRVFYFQYRDKDGVAWDMPLPISPSNLSITTPFATVVTPTLYGTVEEHSPVRYYDINIEGNTGMGPRYVLPWKHKDDVVYGGGRGRFFVKSAIDNSFLGQTGLFKKTLNAAGDVFDQAKELMGQPEPSAGLKLDQTGYLAFHNLYRFLLKYKKDVSGADGNGAVRTPDSPHPLVFVSNKDNNQYNVVIKSMSMRRDKEDPMLYHYSIAMRGYELKVSTANAVFKSNKDLAKALGLDGVAGSNFLQDMTKKVAAAKAMLASASNGVNQVGR